MKFLPPNLHETVQDSVEKTLVIDLNCAMLNCQDSVGLVDHAMQLRIGPVLVSKPQR